MRRLPASGPGASIGRERKRNSHQAGCQVFPSALGSAPGRLGGAAVNVVEPGSRAEHILGRAKELILRPLPAWDEIAAEDTTIEALFRSWVAPLAAIPAVAGALGRLAFGPVELFGVRFHPSVVGIV